jgi:ABC-type dipeptide/oligopeptide/nickel transport system permease subunit
MTLTATRPRRLRAFQVGWRNSSGLVGGAGVALLTLLALWITVDESLLGRATVSALVADPYRTSFRDKLLAPDATHLFGTDALGRDVLARVIYGASTSFVVAVASVLLALPFGVVGGLTAGYYRGWWDRVSSTVLDVILTLPSLLLALAMVGILGPGLLNIVVALAIVNIPAFARLVRADAMRLRNQEFMESARLSGETDGRLMFSELLPNCLTGLIVQLSFSAGLAIIYEAGISFLGLGISPPRSSWGLMLSEGREYIRDAWWLSVFPGLAIMLAVLSFNLLGDEVRRRLDPRREVTL